MLIPIQSACCFRCGFKNTKLRVDDLIDNMPDEATPLCIKQMLLPSLLRIARLDPCSMPLTWTTHLPIRAPELPSPPTKKEHALIKIRYWEMCRVIQTTCKVNRRMLERLHSLAMAILRRLQTANIPDRDIYGTWFQINLAMNTDSAASIVLLVSESSRPLDSFPSMVDTLAECGALRYALALGRNIKSKKPEVLDAFCSLIEHRLREEEYRFLLLAVSISDKGSTLHVLGSDPIFRISQLMRSPQMILWEDILRQYIKHDTPLEVACE